MFSGQTDQVTYREWARVCDEWPTLSRTLASRGLGPRSGLRNRSSELPMRLQAVIASVGACAGRSTFAARRATMTTPSTARRPPIVCQASRD
jgi:hypothetical protein